MSELPPKEPYREPGLFRLLYQEWVQVPLAGLINALKQTKAALSPSPAQLEASKIGHKHMTLGTLLWQEWVIEPGRALYRFFEGVFWLLMFPMMIILFLLIVLGKLFDIAIFVMIVHHTILAFYDAIGVKL